MATRGLASCAKCKVARAVAVGNQTEFLCGQCLRNSLVAKFKSAVNQHKLVQRGDKVLLAFSGGHASRSALSFLSSIQAPSSSFEHQGQSARGRIPFSLGVVFVDERTITGLASPAADNLAAEVESIVDSYGLPFYNVHLESIFDDRSTPCTSCSSDNINVDPTHHAPCIRRPSEAASDDVPRARSNQSGEPAVLLEGISGTSAHQQNCAIDACDGSRLLKRDPSAHQTATCPDGSMLTMLPPASVSLRSANDDCDGSRTKLEGNQEFTESCNQPARNKEPPQHLRDQPSLCSNAAVKCVHGGNAAVKEDYGSNAAVKGVNGTPDDPTPTVSHADRLRRLVQLARDSTGAEDLVSILRLELLQQVALAGGYNRLVLGTTTSRVASLVLASISKGVGFSLPADIQFFDGRWPVHVICPLRDCAAEELAVLCHLDGLKTVFVPNMSTSAVFPTTANSITSRPTLTSAASKSASINSLTAKFVAAVQRENQSRQNTIMRTALKLHPFAFNQDPAALAAHPERNTRGDDHRGDDSRGGTSRGDYSRGDNKRDDNGRGNNQRDNNSEGDCSRGDNSTGVDSRGDIRRGDAEAMLDNEEGTAGSCPLCMAPLPLSRRNRVMPPTFCAEQLHDSTGTGVGNGEMDREETMDSAEQLKAACCHSCACGILPLDGASLMRFIETLPDFIRQRMPFERNE